jgi:predicted dehydrogenase
MTQLGVGIVGMGVGERHIGGFRRHPAVKVVALCDVDPEVQARVSRTYPDVEVVDDAGALIDDARIGIVSIASYDDSHYGEVMRALRLDKHVFVEKPLCLRVEEFRHIRELLSQRPHLRLSSNLVLRRSPRFLDLRERIAKGELGKLFNIEGDYAYGRLHKLTQGWRGRIPDYSVTLGGAIHLIDLILWLTGERVAEVTAIGNGIASAGSDFHGDDMVSALLRFESGLVGKISANFGCVFPHFHRLLVYGTRATFENGRDAALMWRSRDPDVAPEQLTLAYPGVDKGDLIPSFVDAILGRGAAAVTEEDVLGAMAVGLAVDRAVVERRVVKVAEI